MSNIIQNISQFYRDRFYAERFEIMKFIKFASSQIKPSDVVLDAGAGNKQPYKQQFSHTRYESTDMEQSPNDAHTFLCSLDNMPRPDSTYDAIVCTQVLEHVEFPQKVVHEFYRILKPEGRLFLTAPQGARVHGEPYHFFNFTQYGLASMFRQAGFDIIFIRPNGGYFWNLAKRTRTLPRYISKQYKDPELADKISIYNRLCWLMMVPVLFLLKPLYKYIVPVLFFYLDSLDKKKLFTLGYCCYCVKPRASVHVDNV